MSIDSTCRISEAAMEVTAVNASARTITVDDDGASADNDYLFRAGNFTASSTENEMNGLRFILGTQNYAGITASSNPVWNGLTAGSSTTGISEVLIDEAVEKVETDGNGTTPSLFVAEHAQRRKLASQLQAQKRYSGNDVSLKAGWKGLELARGALVVDRYCPSTKVFVINPSEVGWFVGLDWTWDDDDGKVLYKALDDSDAVQARFKGYMNLEAYTRNAHTVITVAEPTF